MSNYGEKTIIALVDWLKEQVNKAGVKGLLVGVSGGVDSAVAAFLIKKACPENSLGVIMPCKSDPRDREDALQVVAAAGLKHVELDLTAEHEALFERIERLAARQGLDVSPDSIRIADANLRARLRMSSLYVLANSLNCLVVGTDNAAETYTGYFTKYGDGGVDILPLANFNKRQVRELARIVGVPTDIITKPPSAGLWAGQTDEAEMCTTYDAIDDFLEGQDVPERDRDIILRLHRVSEHKRNFPPVFPGLSD